MDQCCVISFHAQQINQVRKSIPELSCGFLNDDASSLSNILNKVSNYDSTFNPSYGRVNAELMQSASHRGVSIWPWTVNDERSFANFYLAGTWGITTNRADFVKDYIKFLTPEESYSKETKLFGLTFTPQPTVSLPLVTIKYHGINLSGLIGPHPISE